MKERKDNNIEVIRAIKDVINVNDISDFTEEEAQEESKFYDKLVRESEDVINFSDLYDSKDNFKRGINSGGYNKKSK